jgi:MHS family proline/betaine transporter-like MFS transporter
MGSGHSRMTPRAVAAATSGNVLEWYDFTVYGFLAPTLGRIFFPSDDHVASLLSAFAVLAVGYAARPIGSVIYGHIGDRFGRKPALLSSVTLMGVGSLLIGFLPTYAEIGVTAAVLLIVIRVVQGISVAGEYMASGVLIVEEARDRSRGFVGSWIACAMMLGCVLGSGVPALITSFLTDSQISAWGWRIPFFFGGAVALFGAVLRLHLSESTALSGTAERSKSPIRMAVREYWPSILRMIALLIPTAIIYFMIFVYAASYLTGRMHFSTAQALDISTINLVAIAVLGLAAGCCSDRFGRRAVLLFGAIGTLIVAWPMWLLMHQDSLVLVFLGQLGFAGFNAIGWALSITVLSEMVPTRVRCSAVALSYNACMAVFGGTTPIVATYLVTRTGDDYAPVYYVMAATLVSLLVILRLPKTAASAR